MNDIKDICDGLLATSPPPPDSAAVLATARRSAARHRATVAAGVATLAVVVAAGVSVVALRPATGPGPGPAAVQQPPPAVAAPSSAPAVVVKETPAARAAYTHGATMRGLLLAIIPAGYTTADYPTNYDKDFDPDAVLPNAQFPAPADGLLNVAFGGLLLHAGGGEGMLTASIWATAAPASEEGCPPASCEVVTVDGVSVQVRTWSDDSGRHIAATRRLKGGSLSVIASQGMGTGGTGTPLDGGQRHPRVKPALPVLPFTTQQIAALALDPAMLQFP